MRDIVSRLRETTTDKDNMPRMDSERWFPVGLAKEAAAEIERLRAAVKWTREVRPGKTKDGSAVVEMTWDQFNTMRALACVQQPPCKRCGSKGEYTVEITNHGERNEFFQEVCNDCSGGPVQSLPNGLEQRLADAEADVLRLHKEKCDLIDRAIEIGVIDQLRGPVQQANPNWEQLKSAMKGVATDAERRPVQSASLTWHCARCDLTVGDYWKCSFDDCRLADPKSLPEAPGPASPATCSVCGVNPPSFWNRLIENFSCTPCFVRDADSKSHNNRLALRPCHPGDDPKAPRGD